MAVGNTGEYLEQAADAMCTWLSRDGGATWQDVMPYAGIYECASAYALSKLCTESAKLVGACLPGLGCIICARKKYIAPWAVHQHRRRLLAFA